MGPQIVCEVGLEVFLEVGLKYFRRSASKYGRRDSLRGREGRQETRLAGLLPLFSGVLFSLYLRPLLSLSLGISMSTIISLSLSLSLTVSLSISPELSLTLHQPPLSPETHPLANNLETPDSPPLAQGGTPPGAP